MNTAVLLAALHEHGISLERRGERLHVSAPPGVITPSLQAVLSAHKAELLALLSGDDPEVAWRVEAMRPQVPPAGPIHFLVARHIPVFKGCCLSCGDPLPSDTKYRCAPCARAAYIVINQVREDVSPTAGVSAGRTSEGASDPAGEDTRA